MPADPVPNSAIPELATRVNSPEIIGLLQRILQAGVIWKREADPDTTASLQRLTDVGLVDPVYDRAANGLPDRSASNSNGWRVLMYLTGIRSGPHYTAATRAFPQNRRERAERREASMRRTDDGAAPRAVLVAHP